MHRGPASLLAAGACSYPPLTPFCDPTDPDLVACYEFEADAGDGSSHGLDARLSNVSFVPGKVGNAAQFTAASSALVDHSPVLDVQALTVEAWVRLAQLPVTAGTTSKVIDVGGQYSFSIHPNGSLTCDLTGPPPDAGTLPPVPPLMVGQWAHIACTFDGDATSRIYVDGTLVATGTGPGKLVTGNLEMSIGAATASGGDPLVGLIDQLRLMSVARSAAEICADAGQTGCGP